MISLTPIQMKLAGAALGVLAIASAVFYVRHLKTDLQAAREKVTELQVKLKVQNEAILQMKKDSDAREIASKEMLEVAKKDADSARVRASSIHKAQPSTPGNDCKSALDLING